MKKTMSPVFDEDFTFYGIDPSDLKFVSLHFTLLSFDRFSRDIVVGEVIFQLDQNDFDSLDKVINLTRNILPRRVRTHFYFCTCVSKSAEKVSV